MKKQSDDTEGGAKTGSGTSIDADTRAARSRIEANTLRLAKILGCPLPKPSSTQNRNYKQTLHPHLEACRSVDVRESSVEFKLDLPLDEAEEILKLLVKLPKFRAYRETHQSDLFDPTKQGRCSASR